MGLIYDKDKLYKLIYDFHVVTGLQVSAFDTNFNGFLTCPQHHRGYCAAICANPKGKKRCLSSDITALTSKTVKSGEICIFRCHAGLTEVAMAVKDNYDNSVGYFMLGQVRTEEISERQLDDVIAQLGDIDVNTDMLKELYYQVPLIDENQLISAARLLRVCAVSAWHEKYISIKKDDLSVLIDRYIESNLSSKLSLDHLAKTFLMSKTALCSYAKEHYGISIGEIIKQKRVECAKNMLENTNHPLSTISECVGISDINYFIKVFKSITGKTPSRYRKEIRTGQT